MSQILAAGGATSETVGAQLRRRRPDFSTGKRGQWWRFALIGVITLIVITPIFAVLYLATQPGQNSTTAGFTLENFANVFGGTEVLTWLSNSLIVALATVVAAVAVAAPAGYVLSRLRNRLVSGYSLTLFVIQSLPAVTAAIPLFITFSVLGLVNTLQGVAIVFIGSAKSGGGWDRGGGYKPNPLAPPIHAASSREIGIES